MHDYYETWLYGAHSQVLFWEEKPLVICIYYCQLENRNYEPSVKLLQVVFGMPTSPPSQNIRK